MSRARRRLAAMFGIAAIAAPIAGCGDDNDGDSTTAATDDSTTTSTQSTTQSDANPLEGINPPSGSKELDSSDIDGGTYMRYSTSDSPKSVISSYESEFKGAGWSIVSSGGNGGGWGPYGGSGAGITAQKDGTYADVQAGGEKGGTTYFEVCAGTGTREDCHNASNDSNSNSGGSQGQNQNNDQQTNSGGS